MKKNRYQMPTMEVISLATQFCLAGAGSGSASGPGAVGRVSITSV